MKKKTAFVIILLLSIILILYLLKFIYVLTIEDTERGKIILSKKVEPGFEFVTLIKHSVQKSPVYEYYCVEKDGTITVTKTMLQDLGWGMPSTSDHKVEFKNNFMIINGVDRSLNALTFRVNYIAKPKIIIDNRELDLMEYVGNNKAIKIYVIKNRNISHLMGVK